MGDSPRDRTEKSWATSPGCPGADSQTRSGSAGENDVILELTTLGDKDLKLGRYAEAASLYREAIRLRPADPGLHRRLGRANYLQGRLSDAVNCFRRGIELDPEDADLHNDLAVSYAELGWLEQAIARYRDALRLRSEFADALYNLANALRQQGNLSEANRCYQEALRLNPAFAEAYNNLGSVLRAQGCPEEAASCFRRALRLRPGFAMAHNNLGLVLAEAGNLDGALAHYGAALEMEPDFPEAHRNRALVWLQKGDMANGWPEYEWRRMCPDSAPIAGCSPEWDGSPLEGRSILLHAEQGLGDILQFVRYAPLVRERGGRVTLAAPESLHKLLARCDGIDRLVPVGVEVPGIDVTCPLMSLPGIFGTTLETVPARVPYIRPDCLLVEAWRRELSPIEGFRVGIAWAGNPRYLYDRSRSFPLRSLAPIAAVEGLRLVSLQRGPGVEQLAECRGVFPVVEFGSQIDGSAGAFVDTAGMMMNLDLVITCDTSIAHLAGALGVPTWLALPKVPDWRWLLERDDSPWYPTFRLFRRGESGGWDALFESMARELDRLLRGQPLEISIVISPGELIDRVLILELKVARARESTQLLNIRDELNELRATLQQGFVTEGRLQELVDQLRAVNLAIWEAEDGLRLCEQDGDFGSRFIELARSVYRNNDRRAALKRVINEVLGWKRQEEKLYRADEVRDGGTRGTDMLPGPAST